MLFGLDGGTVGGLLFIICGIVIVTVLVTSWYVKNHGSPAAKAELARVRAGERDRIDDLYKQTPAYDAAKQFEAAAKEFAAHLGPAFDNLAAKLRQELAEARGTVAAPVAPAEGIDAAAKRLGVDAAVMRFLAKLHPGETWETLADRINNPAKYFTDADRDTVAAATGKV